MKRINSFVPALALGSTLLMPVLPSSLALADDMSGKPQADQQGNNKSDIDVTAKIRRSIMADKTMSTSAHNVKIITKSGMVTLRGQVKTADEKDSVVAKAKEVAGAANVTDDLTVAPAK